MPRNITRALKRSSPTIDRIFNNSPCPEVTDLDGIRLTVFRWSSPNEYLTLLETPFKSFNLQTKRDRHETQTDFRDNLVTQFYSHEPPKH